MVTDKQIEEILETTARNLHGGNNGRYDGVKVEGMTIRRGGKSKRFALNADQRTKEEIHYKIVSMFRRLCPPIKS